MMNIQDTIVAVSTPPGRGGLGVVRLSGGEARGIAACLLRFAAPFNWTARVATVAELLDEEQRTVDQVIVTWFAKPRSYTAEDIVEISCHGSPVVLRHCVEQACRHGARLAEPGEFTLRAFVNGRIDLPQAEAVHDLIESTTLYQARVAAQQTAGSISRRLKPVKDQFIDLIALLEAGIDFAEDDVSVAGGEELLARSLAVEVELEALVRSYAYGKLVHDGFTLAIAGRPNVGKSSLFNRLVEQDRAIVTAIAGTTRDVVSETASLHGIPVRFVDTAGIREGVGEVETLGIERSYQAMADADLTLVVTDRSQPADADDQRLIDHARTQGRHLIVANKADLPRASAPGGDGCIEVSALTGDGIGELRRRALAELAPAGRLEQEGGFITSIRHERCLRESLEAIRHTREAIRNGIPHEMLLLDLYATLQPIDAITGATTVDDILDHIFSSFCIGK